MTRRSGNGGRRTLAGAAALLALLGSAAAEPYPNQREADLVVKDFPLEGGGVLPEARLHYTTLGTPHRDADGEIDNAVLLLHGTTGTGKQFLMPTLGPELFAEGAPLDAKTHFIILPDGLGRIRISGSRAASTTATSSRGSTASSPRGSGSSTSGRSSAPRWAGCRPGCGASATLR